jgi:nucleotide-binding universal stress UspA family protein
MRILFATDGSVAATRARDLLAGLNLPLDSYIRVVGVRRGAPDLSGARWVRVAEDTASFAGTVARAGGTAVMAPASDDHFAIMLDTTVTTLEGPGRRVERVILYGHAGAAIVDDAREMAADLVVVGSRGHGTIESMLLGSVSRHVVAHAPCSVLVARSERIRSVLFATDGSDSAKVAEDAIGTWPMFRGHPVRVVSVAQTSMPMPIGGVPGLYDQVMEQYDQDVDAARAEATALANTSVQRLVEVGRAATGEMIEGDPAGEILRAATAHHCDLIVTGTQGRTGVSRLVLGSVAGNVAGHATMSVLVIRQAPH